VKARWLACPLLGLVVASACDVGAPSEVATSMTTAVPPGGATTPVGGFVVRGERARAMSPIGVGVAVSAEGLELSLPSVVDGTTVTTPLRMRTLRLDGAKVPAGTLAVEGAQARLRRPGLDEWFVNGARGLEHGYTVHASRDGDAAIRIDLAFEGLEATVRSAELVTFADDRGRARLQYRAPHAEDARGRSLAIAFEEAPEGLELVVQAEGAAYPVTIDPTFELAETLFATMPGFMANYGQAAAIDGTWAVVGAPFEGTSGAIYVYELVNGVWSLDEHLVLMGGNAAQFGRNLAIDGDTLVVGAPSLSGGGLVRVYRHTMAGWTIEADLQPSTTSGVAPLAVDVEGDRLVIGDADDDSLGTNAGTAYVYERDGTNTWNLVAELQDAAGGGANDRFGRSVALTGDQVLIGAPSFDFGGTAEGQIYVFDRVAGSWQTTPSQLLDGASYQRNDANLGQVIAAEGDRLVARNKAASGSSKPNEILVFDRSGGTWTGPTAIEPPGLTNEDVGVSLDVVGDRVVAGSPVAGALQDGLVHIFERTGGTWQEVQVLANPTPLLNDYFGDSVALNAAGMILVGDPQDNQVGGQAGAVYTFPLVGDPCTDGSTCATGICDEMVCCNVPCGPCGVCDTSGNEGQCVALGDGAQVPECEPVLCANDNFDCPDCETDTDCVGGYFCQSGSCLPDKADGEACAGDDECQSLHCVDGVCCNSACEAQCQACDEPGSVGTCVTIMGQPHGSRPPCPADFCEEDIAYSDSSCRGGLECEADSTPCTPYACDETTCHNGCLSTQQCAEGFICRVDDGNCVSTDVQCDGSTLTFPDDTTQSCVPYRCSDAGVCFTQCTSGEQCSEGRVCDSTGACVTPPPAIGTLSCLVGSGERSPSRWGWLLALGGLALLRRRRAR